MVISSERVLWAENSKMDFALLFLSIGNVSCLFLFHSSFVLMGMLANCSVLQDLQLHSLFLSLSLRIKLPSVTVPGCSKAGFQIYPSERACKLVAGRPQTLSRNGQKGCKAEKQTEKWAFYVMQRGCPLLPCSNCKPVAGSRWFVAWESISLCLSPPLFVLHPAPRCHHANNEQ